jgi:hypothetical protein
LDFGFGGEEGRFRFATSTFFVRFRTGFFGVRTLEDLDRDPAFVTFPALALTAFALVFSGPRLFLLEREEARPEADDLAFDFPESLLGFAFALPGETFTFFLFSSPAPFPLFGFFLAFRAAATFFLAPGG